MPISTYKIFLMKKGTGSGATYSKLIDIKEFPDLGGAPENLETTTLSDRARTYIPGIQEQESMEFLANYTLSDYIALKALEGTDLELAVWFGGTEDASTGVVTPTGSDGKFEFGAMLSVSIPGKGVNEVVDMTITVTPTTPINQTATVSQ